MVRDTQLVANGALPPRLLCPGKRLFATSATVWPGGGATSLRACLDLRNPINVDPDSVRLFPSLHSPVEMPAPGSSNLRTLLLHSESHSDGLVSIDELESAWGAIPNHTVATHINCLDLADIDLDWRQPRDANPTPRATTAPLQNNITVSCFHPFE